MTIEQLNRLMERSKDFHRRLDETHARIQDEIAAYYALPWYKRMFTNPPNIRKAYYPFEIENKQYKQSLNDLS